MGQKQKQEKTKGATGLGRVTRQQIQIWNQMTALRFQRGGNAPESLDLPSGLVWRDVGQMK